MSRQPAREDFRSSLGIDGSLITDHYSYQRGVGRILGVGRDLGVGVGLGVAVGVGVGVGSGATNAYTLLSPAT